MPQRIMTRPKFKLAIRKRAAYTLVELLTVIAIIGILAAILIPAVGGARDAARKAKTRSEMQQMIIALDQYFNEYRFWPQVVRPSDNSDEVFDDIATTNINAFVIALTGRNPDGSTPGNSDQKAQNRKLKKFYEFGDSLIGVGNDVQWENGLGIPSLVILVDGDSDGILKKSSFPVDAQPAEDIRAKIAMWSLDGEDGDAEVWAATYDF